MKNITDALFYAILKSYFDSNMASTHLKSGGGLQIFEKRPRGRVLAKFQRFEGTCIQEGAKVLRGLQNFGKYHK